jgi:hypothetical protein
LSAVPPGDSQCGESRIMEGFWRVNSSPQDAVLLKQILRSASRPLVGRDRSDRYRSLVTSSSLRLDRACAKRASTSVDVPGDSFKLKAIFASRRSRLSNQKASRRIGRKTVNCTRFCPLWSSMYAVSFSRGLARGRTQDSTRTQRLTFPCLGCTEFRRLLEL